MSFFVIFLCLAFERLVVTQLFTLRAVVFDYCFIKIAQLVPRRWQEQPYGLWLFLFPILFVTAVLHTFSIYYFSSLSNVIIEVILLWYCLGPFNIYYRDSNISQDLFERAHTGLFSILFWFVLLGPTGAILFRILERISNPSEKLLENISENVVIISKLLTSYLSWFPIRLFIAIQSAFGKFPDALRYWLDHLLTSASNNEQFISHSGRIALGLPVEASLQSEDYSRVVMLFDKVLLVFLGIILAYNILAWII